MDENETLETLEQGSAETGENGASQQGAEQETRGAAENAEGAGNADRQKQTRQEDARYAAARRAGKREAEEAITARIKASRIPDPRKEGAFLESLESVEAYGQSLNRARLEREAQKSGKSVADLEQEEREREAGRKLLKEREDAESNSRFIQEDIRAFREAFPAVDLAKLDENKSFRRFCGTRYGREPLAELYADFLDVVGGAEKSAGVKAESKSERSTGSGSGQTGGGLTAEQRARLEEWNRENPGMKMTEKEFMAR